MGRPLGEVLVSHGVIDEIQLDELLAEQAAEVLGKRRDGCRTAAVGRAVTQVDAPEPV
jgi:hypothetical protein